MPIYLILIVEDQLGSVVVEKLLSQTQKDYKIVNVLLWDKHKIKNKINDINKTAKGQVFLVLTDQDTPDWCPPRAIEHLSKPMHPNLLYRFAVMEVESWIMAHREAISEFLSIPVNNIPVNIDDIPKPKEFLIKLARRSRYNNIRESIVPAEGSTAKVGPDYNNKISEFVRDSWDVQIASECSPSLKRAFRKLKQFTPSILIP